MREITPLVYAKGEASYIKRDEDYWTRGGIQEVKKKTFQRRRYNLTTFEFLCYLATLSQPAVFKAIPCT